MAPAVDAVELGKLDHARGDERSLVSTVPMRRTAGCLPGELEHLSYALRHENRAVPPNGTNGTASHRLPRRALRQPMVTSKGLAAKRRVRPPISETNACSWRRARQMSTQARACA